MLFIFKSLLGLKKFLLVLLLITHGQMSLAATKENRIIDKAVQAYGGSKLTHLRSLTFTDTMNHYTQWQSGHSLQGDMVGYLNEEQIELTIDFKNQQKVFKQATSRLVGSHGTDIPSITHRIFKDGKGYLVDHALLEYTSSKNINFDNADLGISRLLDPIIIMQLDNDRDNAVWTDVAYIQGVAHDVLTVNSGTKDEYTVYLNMDNGYLTRLIAKKNDELFSYDFLEHQLKNDVAWAKQLFVSKSTGPVYHSRNRKISFNSVDSGNFNMPGGYSLSATKKFIDSAELTIRQLANGIYFVGQDWGYTLFVDAGDYYISAGAWQTSADSGAWQKSLDLLRVTTGNSKPIKQHIVTHHHEDHLMGLDDIVKQGATLVVHPNDIPIVQHHVSVKLPESRILPFTEKLDLASGKIKLFDIPNSHANHNLIVYLPAEKILFSEDMFGSSFQRAFHSPANWPDLDTYGRLKILLDNVDKLGLNVEQYLSSHHARILTHKEIDNAAKIVLPNKETLLWRLFAKTDDESGISVVIK